MNTEYIARSAEDVGTGNAVCRAEAVHFAQNYIAKKTSRTTLSLEILMTKGLDRALTQLKQLQKRNTERVEKLSTQLAVLQSRLAKAREMAAQAKDAVDALEGRPTLKKQLEDAMARQLSSVSQFAPPTLGAVGTESTKLPPSEVLPPAEPGFRWAKDEIGQDVLVPINQPMPSEAATAVPILLPPVLEGDEFADAPETLL